MTFGIYNKNNGYNYGLKHLQRISWLNLSIFNFALNFINRIIPFVAADAVHGVPSNFDDDERLSLGGLSTNQQLTHPIVSGKKSKENIFLFLIL